MEIDERIINESVSTNRWTELQSPCWLFQVRVT
jgi:hypothetical protein